MSLQTKKTVTVHCNCLPPTNVCFGVVTSGHVTKIVVTSFNLPYQKNPMQHANFMVLIFYTTRVIGDKSFNCGNKDFSNFLLLWPWLDLDLMTITDELKPNPLEMYW